jgi:thioredoxin 1
MDRPTVFADESFATALEKTRSSPGLLIVDASAEWCGPCKHMDRTTWRDMEVVSWCEANATVLQIDVDQEKEWAQTHRISAMPTLIAFKNGAEFDRIVGGRQPRALLEWLEGLLKGETSIETLRRLVSEREADAEKRFELARALHASGDLDEATREFAWLWEHITEANPEMAGVRVSFMASEMEALAARSEPARSRFREIRDRNVIGTDSTGQARLDWIVLNEVLGETDATLGWFDRFAATRPAKLDLPELAHRLIPLLLSRDRWADASRLIDDAVDEVTRYHDYFISDTLPPDFDEELAKQIKEMGRDSFREKVAQIRQMLIAGNRSDEAAAVEQKALSLDSSDEMKQWLAKPRDQLLAMS